MAFKYNGTNVNTTQISGPTGYIAEGSPTFQNGILSNIDDQNYFKTAEEFNTDLNFSIIVKYKVLADGNLTYFIGNTDGFQFYSTGTSSNNLAGVIRQDSEDEWTTLNVPTISHQANTWYILQFDYDGTNTYTVTVKNESGTTLGTSTTTSDIIVAAGDICFGYNGGSAAEEIDLNNTYIYINNKLWFWQPKEANYVQTGSQVNSKLVWANPHLYLEGPVTYTKVGNPTITDNIASDFSNDDYLKIDQTISIGDAKTYEIFTKFTTPSSLTHDSNIVSIQTYYAYGIYINVSNNRGTIKVNSHSDGSYYTISGNSDQVEPSSTYWVHYIVDGENGSQTLKTSLDGKVWSTWTNSYTTGKYNDNSILWQIGKGAYGVSECQIDLNNTYIILNGNLFFYGRNYATQNIAPVPANYSYGTTTTTGIGFVDTRTQQYTELPSGVTLGNDSNITLKRLTINAPSGSTVIINGNNVSNVSLPSNSSYTYSVSQSGYKTLSGSGTLSDNTTIDVCSVMVSGSNTTVNIDSSGYNNVFVIKGSTISFTASKTNYKSYSSTKTVNTNTNITIANLTANISPTPDYIFINGEEFNGILFEDGTIIDYEVLAVKKEYDNMIKTGTINTSLIISDQMSSTLTPLKFTALQDNSTIQFSQTNVSRDVKYSTDLTNWTTMTTSDTITLDKGEFVYLKGSNTTLSTSGSNLFQFTMSGKIAASGNVNSMLDNGDGSTINSIPSYCYLQTFWNCKSLILAPKLPATTLNEHCYNLMFRFCESLLISPELPATTLAQYCYANMFANCKALKYTYELPAVTLALYCYNSMFSACQSLIEAPELPATTLVEGCYNYMFSSCSNLIKAPLELPGLSLQKYCYRSMFTSCSSLIKAPYLKFTSTNSTADSCKEMFYNCTSLNEIRTDYTGNFGTYFNNWVYNVASLGDFYYNGSDTTRGDSNIPTNWNIITTAQTATLTINAPIGATVTINGTEQTSLPIVQNSSYTYSVSKQGYTTLNGSGTIGTTNETINIAELTTNITPTPDSLTINGENVEGAYFVDGTSLSYTIVATKSGYNNLTLTGTVSTTTTVTGTMQVNYPSFSGSYSTVDNTNSIVYEVTITDATAGNYDFTIRGQGGTSGSTSAMYGNKRYYGGGRGGTATGKIYLAPGTKISFQTIGAIQPNKNISGVSKGSSGKIGIGLYINDTVKLVAGGAGQGSYIIKQNSGSSITYAFYEYNGGGGGYNGGLGADGGYGLSYDGTQGNNTSQTSGTPYGGNGGTSNTSTSYGNTAKGGSGYIASNFTQGSITTDYTVISLTCVGGSNWGSSSSGNSLAATISFSHE